jgi:sodium transport system ATP-binding protein
MLEVKNLTKTFTRTDKKNNTKTTVGIHDLNFQANQGRVFGLIGANGAGKTTTMRIVANLTYPHSGEITLNQQPYANINDIKMRVSFVSGETQVYDRLTPFEIMNLFGRFANLSGKSLEDKIRFIADKLDMNEFLHDVCLNFSTGMKQKVSIARALVTDPEILIFDEVTNGLDIFASRAVKEQILALKAEGKTILYSTHIMSDAEDLCDDIAILHNGRILDTGKVSDLKQKYSLQKIEEIFFSLAKD